MSRHHKNNMAKAQVFLSKHTTQKKTETCSDTDSESPNTSANLMGPV